MKVIKRNFMISHVIMIKSIAIRPLSNVDCHIISGKRQKLLGNGVDTVQVATTKPRVIEGSFPINQDAIDSVRTI